MNQIKVGVIGAGRMGRNHCRVYSTLRNVQLVGITDRSLETGQCVAQQYETTFYPKMEELLAKVDAVSIVTPTPTHCAIALECLARGLHVFIEKPIAATVEEAELLTTYAQFSGKVVQIGHIERFNPTYIELKHVIEGVHPAAITLRRLSPYVGSNMDVDVVLDLMIHDLDLLLNLMGRQPLTVKASGLTAFSGEIDHAVVNCTFANGPLVTVIASRLTEQKVRSIEVTALEAYIEGDLLHKSIDLHRRTTGEYVAHNHDGVKYHQESMIERIHVPMAEPLCLELQHFITCVREQQPPLVSAADGLKALQLAMGIRRQIHEQLILITPADNGMATAPQRLWQPVAIRA